VLRAMGMGRDRDRRRQLSAESQAPGHPVDALSATEALDVVLCRSFPLDTFCRRLRAMEGLGKASKEQPISMNSRADRQKHEEAEFKLHKLERYNFMSARAVFRDHRDRRAAVLRNIILKKGVIPPNRQNAGCASGRRSRI